MSRLGDDSGHFRLCGRDVSCCNLLDNGSLHLGVLQITYLWQSLVLLDDFYGNFRDLLFLARLETTARLFWSASRQAVLARSCRSTSP